MAVVQLEGLSKRYGGNAEHSVRSLTLTIADGEFMVLLGPSGCGKSTALRMIAGLEPISSGTIAIDGRVVHDVPAKDRDIEMVFQSYASTPLCARLCHQARGPMYSTSSRIRSSTLPTA